VVNNCKIKTVFLIWFFVTAVSGRPKPEICPLLGRLGWKTAWAIGLSLFLQGRNENSTSFVCVFGEQQLHHNRKCLCISSTGVKAKAKHWYNICLDDYSWEVTVCCRISRLQLSAKCNHVKYYVNGKGLRRIGDFCQWHISWLLVKEKNTTLWQTCLSEQISKRSRKEKNDKNFRDRKKTKFFL